MTGRPADRRLIRVRSVTDRSNPSRSMTPARPDTVFSSCKAPALYSLRRSSRPLLRWGALAACPLAAFIRSHRLPSPGLEDEATGSSPAWLFNDPPKRANDQLMVARK